MMTSEVLLQKFPLLTRKFLEDLVKKAENLTEVEVIDVAVKDVGEKGDHYASLMYRIIIKYSIKKGEDEDAARRWSLIVKTLPEGAEMIKCVREFNFFPTEMRMFSDTLKKLHEIFSKVKRDGENRVRFGAESYYVDKASNILVFEDLALKGFRMAEKRRRLDINHSKLVMRTLGKFHAASIALHAIDPQSIECYSRNTFDIDPDSTSFLAVLETVRSLADVVKSWPENGKRLSEKLRKRVNTFIPDSRDSRMHDPNSFNVLIHGDLWVNNLLFKYDEQSGEVQDVRFVDFQWSYYTSPGIDLQYFIHSSVEEEVQINSTEVLLRTYHAELCKSLELLGHEDKAISFDELLKEYENKFMWGFYPAIFILPLLLSAKEDTIDFEASLNKHGNSNAMYNRLTNKEYTKVIKRLLPVFDAKGVL